MSHEDKGEGFLLDVVSRPGISSFTEFSQLHLENLLEIIYIQTLSLFSQTCISSPQKTSSGNNLSGDFNIPGFREI